MSLPLAKMDRAVTTRLLTQMCGAITRLITKATTRLLTGMGRAITRLLTETGQATLKLLTKMVEAIVRSSTRQSFGCRRSGRPLIRIPTLSGGGVARKPLPPKPISSGGDDHHIKVDNNEEHEMVTAQASWETDDEGKLADACGEDDVISESSTSVVVEEPSRPLYKEAVVQGSPVKEDDSPKEVPKRGKVGIYGGWQRILLVGEGDFSFSACLATAFGDASNMVATSLDTFDFLKKNYEKATDNIKELRSRGCKVLHRVDATKMANHPKLCTSKFDCIIYNFPHAGFTKLNEPREAQISHHQTLVSKFMENAKQMVEDDGQIHITHKCTGFSKDWNIDQLGKSKGLLPLKAVKFKLQTYPGYHTKYGYGGDKDFDYSPSKTYKFVRAPEKKESQKKKKN